MNVIFEQRILKNFKIFGYVSFIILIFAVYGIRILTIHFIGEKTNGVIIDYDKKGGGPNSRPFKLIYIKNNQIKELKIGNNIHLSNSVNDVIDVYCANYFGSDWCFAYKKQCNTNIFFIYSITINQNVKNISIFKDSSLVNQFYVGELSNFGYETKKSGHFQVYFDSILVSDFIAEQEKNNFKEIH